MRLQHCIVTSGASFSYTKEEKKDMQYVKVLLFKRITWLVLVSYALLMFKPVMPVVMDVLAHTFWEQQHMLTVHEVNGKFHVHNELVQASHQSEKDKQAMGAKYVAGEYFPVAVACKIIAASMYYFEKTLYGCYKCFLPFSVYTTDSPPPQA